MQIVPFYSHSIPVLLPIDVKHQTIQNILLNLGVTDSFAAGLSATEVADKGNWREAASVHFYRRNFPRYSRELAESNTLFMQAQRRPQEQGRVARPRDDWHREQARPEDGDLHRDHR